jgi:hypothetical protein
MRVILEPGVNESVSNFAKSLFPSDLNCIRSASAAADVADAKSFQGHSLADTY